MKRLLAILILLALSCSAQMPTGGVTGSAAAPPIARLQYCYGVRTAGSSFTCVFPGNTTAGALIAGSVEGASCGTITAAINAVGFTKVTTTSSSTFYLPNNAGGQTTVTVTMQVSCAAHGVFAEYSNANAATPADGTPISGTANSASFDSGSIVTAGASDVCVGLTSYNGTEATRTSTAGFTEVTYQQDATMAKYFSFWEKLAVAAGTLNNTGTLATARTWMADVECYKQ